MKYEDLLQKAKEASKNAYAKYSNFKVGACVLASSGKTYTGCNVENASYGLTVCAERNAIANAIVNGETSILAVAIFSPNMQDCPPCGACRQVILEFVDKDKQDIDIITSDEDSFKTYKISKLLPEGFKL